MLRFLRTGQSGLRRASAILAVRPNVVPVVSIRTQAEAATVPVPAPYFEMEIRQGNVHESYISIMIP